MEIVLDSKTQCSEIQIFRTLDRYFTLDFADLSISRNNFRSIDALIWKIGSPIYFFSYFQQCKCVIWISTFRTNDGHITVPIKHIASVCVLYYDFVIIYLVCWYVLTVIFTYLKALAIPLFEKLCLKLYYMTSVRT